MEEGSYAFEGEDPHMTEEEENKYTVDNEGQKDDLYNEDIKDGGTGGSVNPNVNKQHQNAFDIRNLTREINANMAAQQVNNENRNITNSSQDASTYNNVQRFKNLDSDFDPTDLVPQRTFSES